MVLALSTYCSTTYNTTKYRLVISLPQAIFDVQAITSKSWRALVVAYLDCYGQHGFRAASKIVIFPDRTT
jgi:hypothetical protein